MAGSVLSIVWLLVPWQPASSVPGSFQPEEADRPADILDVKGAGDCRRDCM